MSNEESKTESKYSSMMKEFPLLYCRRKLPMTQTCMCWGIECGDGWYEPLRNLSFRLECLNYAIGRKWGFRIEAEQVKEKYGTLRFYYNVRKVSGWFRDMLSFPFRWLAGTGYNLDSNGAEYKVSRFLFSIFYKIGEFIRWKGVYGRKEEVVRTAIDRYVEKLVAECDEECFHTCEDCGAQIGHSWSPRCETLGWVSFICENCAKKHGSDYTIVYTPKEKVEMSYENARSVKESLKRVGRIYKGGKDITDAWKEERKKREQEAKEWENKQKEKANSATPKKSNRKGKKTGAN